jgi:hypothetical protein
VSGVFQYFDSIVRGTEREDMLVILQLLKGMIGEKFLFLNYYKEIPVSYDAVLLNVEHEMAEFSVHEYQAKVINMDKMTLIHSYPTGIFPENMVAEAFYVSSAKRRVILCNFGYAHFRSDMRRFVRVHLDKPVEVEMLLEDDIFKGNVNDISLGGASFCVKSADLLTPGLDVSLFLKLPEYDGNSRVEVGLSATILKVVGENAPFMCIVEFHAEKHSQQQIAYYINLRQVEIIKELKEMKA